MPTQNPKDLDDASSHLAYFAAASGMYRVEKVTMVAPRVTGNPHGT